MAPLKTPAKRQLLLRLSGVHALGLALALAPAAALAQQVPLATLPPLPPPVGLPQLQAQLSCPALQQRLLATVAGQASVWSITIADAQGRLLADLNGNRPLFPLPTRSW